MFKILNLQKDVWISSEYPDHNSGLNTQAYIYSSSYDYVNRVEFNTTVEHRYLCKFDVDEIIENTSGSLSNNEIKLRLNISNLIKTSSGLSVSAFFLNEEFEEGNGVFFDSNIGATWNRKNTVENWFTTGSYFDINRPITASFNESNRYLEFDLYPYVYSCSIGSIQNNGLVIKSNGELPMLSVYSKDTESGFDPKIFIYYSSSNELITGSSTLFTGSLKSNIMSFNSSNYKRHLVEGETFIVYLNLNINYARRSYNYQNNSWFFNGVKYYIRDVVRGITFVPENGTNFCEINEGLLIHFSTKNFPESKYELYATYESDSGIKIVSNPIDFVIVK